MAPALAVLLAGCILPPVPPAAAGRAELPPMLWDHRPEAAGWTRAALAAVAAEDKALAGRVPADIAAWCPGYAKAGPEARRAFWAGLTSAVAELESDSNPAASAGGGQWIGLMQISPRTARANGCTARSAGALKDGAANLSCAVRTFARDVARDGVVAGKGNRGFGRQWTPFRKAAKRREMATWTAAQPYCAKG